MNIDHWHYYLEKFQGFKIYEDDDGYFWDRGGYFETIEECRKDIARWNIEELEHEPR